MKLPIVEGIDKECFAITPEYIETRRTRWNRDSIEKYLENNIGGVYAIFSFSYGWLYVGRGKNIRRRLLDHFSISTLITGKNIINGLPTRSGVFNYIYDEGVLTKRDLLQSLILIFPISGLTEQAEFEKDLIERLEPRYNIHFNPERE